jgi:intein/homing endonuclease
LNKKRILLLFLLTLILLNLLTGCFKKKESEELKVGKYVMQDTELEGMSWVLLEKDNKFQFNRQINLSYLPVGTYSIDGNKLTLYVNENESYVFTIEKDKLIFESSNVDDDLVKKGAVFKLPDKE